MTGFPVDVVRLCVVIRLFVYYTVGEFGEFGRVPPVGGADKISGDSLQTVDMMAVAVRTFGEAVGGILIAAVETAVTVMVH